MQFDQAKRRDFITLFGGAAAFGRSRHARGTRSLPPAECLRLQAVAAARRCTGFSTIGRLIAADKSPKRIASHHTPS